MNIYELRRMVEDRTGLGVTVSTLSQVDLFKPAPGGYLATVASVQLIQADQGAQLRVGIVGDAMTEPTPVDEALIYLRLRLSV